MADKQLPGESWDRATQTDILDWIAFYKLPMIFRFTQRVLGKFDLELFREKSTGDYFIMTTKDIEKLFNERPDDFSELYKEYEHLQKYDLDRVIKSIGLS